MYSAFHPPFRFDNATRTVIDTVAGRGLQAARTLRINYNAIVNVTSAGPVNEWLATAHAVETNSYISTSITFTLVNSTCSDSAEHAASAANGLSVRQIYSHDNRDVVGWGIVVGDPAVMAKTKTGTMRPCTAVLQATDSITGEFLTVAIINASVKNCFDNGNPNKLVDYSIVELQRPRHLQPRFKSLRWNLQGMQLQQLVSWRSVRDKAIKAVQPWHAQTRSVQHQKPGMRIVCSNAGSRLQTTQWSRTRLQDV